MADISQDLINQFKEFTGSERDDVARQALMVCDGNLEQAVGLFFATDGALGMAQQADPQSNRAPPRRNRARAARAARPNVYQFDVESGDEVAVLGEVRRPPERLNDEARPSNSDEEKNVANQQASQNPVDTDGVRNPIAPVTGRLVGQTFGQYYGGEQRRGPANDIFEQFHDFISSSDRRRLRQREDTEEQSSGVRDLAALFRPPIDIIARLDWDYLLPSAREKNQWVLVNIQDPTEFACQVLNRDCWSDENVKNFIKSNMVFWQVYNKSPEGARICGYYGVKTFPAIFIIDPRTAEKVHTITAQEPKEMLNALTGFYEQYPVFSMYDDDIRAQFRAKNTPQR